jgi:broad specificity phosphatase PhoE
MKWPSSITLIRHGESAYNILRAKKNADPKYRLFKKEYEKDYQSPECRRLAKVVNEKFRLGVSDYDTPLTENGKRQAVATGKKLRLEMNFPDAMMVSPYFRTRQTLAGLEEGLPELKEAKRKFDERIREQEHGLSLLYNDWRVFHVMHPEQKSIREMQGPYWYQHPQGESVCNVRDRCREEVAMLIREYSERNILLITHHLTILSFRANLEDLSPEEFIRLDENEKPKNCGVTQYVGNPKLGSDGRLELKFYNKVLY